MCGIIGVFNRSDAGSRVVKGLEMMQARGRDACGLFDGQLQTPQRTAELQIGDSDYAIGHVLHAIVGHVAQPLKETGVLVANCEIYNWKELCTAHGIDAANDAELALALIDKLGFEAAVSEFDGTYALAYLRDGKLWLARDILGIKPLWTTSDLAFCSERKVLEALGYSGVRELNPRKIGVYDVANNKMQLIERPFFTTGYLEDAYPVLKEKTKELLLSAVKKRVPDQKVGVLFSGGIDSTFICLVLRELGIEFTCYTAAVDDGQLAPSKDMVASKEIAKKYGYEHKVLTIGRDEIPAYCEKVIPLIEDSNVVKVGVALPFFLACEEAQRDGVRVLLSGLGSEEIFAGYERHRNALDINKECLHGLLKMYERDLYRDDVVTMYHTIELRLPFLDRDLVTYALQIPGEFKIREGQSKVILRDIAKDMGLAEEYAERKKSAAQYGSNFDRAISKLAKSKGKNKSEYLDGFLDRKIMKLGVLFSSGKDSTYAAHIMKRQNYELTCLISIWSENKDSYMYHTPNIKLTELQAEAMGVPLLVQYTKGEKEAELEDLEIALQRARDEYGIEGVVTGALYSTYQRDRIEKICDKLGLKMFHPLWHIDQEEELRGLLKEGFEVILVSIGAYGLDKSWLGEPLTTERIDRLVKLNTEIGINVAGEGGEFESLVLDCPLFSMRLSIDDAEIHMENECTGLYLIKDASLVDK